MTFKIKAHRVINHTAWVTAKSPEEAREKYLESDFWDESEEDIGVLQSSIHIEEDPSIGD